MTHQLADLLDIPRIQSALDSLYTSSKIPSAIIDNDGVILTGSGWQDVCTKFHRVHTEARRRCIESDLYITGHIHEANPSITYKCPHGLVDTATPIVIEGEHIGTVFTGQLFLEEPDLDFFRAQAKVYGFDEEGYIAAVKKVPVISEQTLQENLTFLAHLTGMLAEMGLKRTREKEAEKRLRENEERYRAMVEGLPDVVMRFDREGRHLFVSGNVSEVVDLQAAQFIGKTHRELEFPEAQCRFWEEAIRGVFDSGASFETEFTLEGRQGPVIFNWRLLPERDAQGMVQSVLSLKRDITGHRRAEVMVRESGERLRVILESTNDGILAVDASGKTIFSNRRFLELWRIPQAIADSGDDNVLLGFVLGQLVDPDGFLWKVKRLYGTADLDNDTILFKDGRIFERYSRPMMDNGSVIGRLWSFRDITEKRRLESQLQQATKMEAVGRLAGGVAHDFNNLLTVITGYCELLLQKIVKGSPPSGEVEEIKQAAERAARLTQQLLAFSRKQIIEPKVLDLNALIVDLHTMLVRLIGEHIELTTVSGEGLGTVKVDPGQFEQILVNLAVNARDAMPDGGKLSIGTSNAELDETYCAAHPDATPGQFVLLMVSDTGYGMTDEVKAQIFEPFFTTKPKGSGTGLGLSMTYGSVKQAGGSIEVLSEVGKGTTVRIYLPRVEPEAAKPRDSWQPEELPDRTGTVLLVEDEDVVRRLCVRVLERLGYKVLQASSGAEAIGIAQGHVGRIDLLLTDVVMPGMNGNELASRLVILHPEAKVLFTSGYTDDTIVHHGVLAEGVSFIGKPYTPSALARKVREVLDQA